MEVNTALSNRKLETNTAVSRERVQDTEIFIRDWFPISHRDNEMEMHEYLTAIVIGI